MTRRILLALAAALTFAAPAVRAADFPEGSPKFHSSYKDAAAEAKKSGKPMLVVFSATWCGPCQVNKKKVYPSAEVKPYHDKFVWAYLDADKDENQKLLTEYGVKGIPYIRLSTADGKVLGTVEGMSKPADFAKKLEAALAKK
jgi:thiol:disulfide interchange protein